MRISSIGYSVGMTIQTAQFESIRPGGNCTVDLDEGDDPAEALKLARKWALIAFVKSSEDIIQIYDWSSKMKSRFPVEIISNMINDVAEEKL
jgi:hypothetical protein